MHLFLYFLVEIHYFLNFWWAKLEYSPPNGFSKAPCDLQKSNEANRCETENEICALKLLASPFFIMPNFSTPPRCF